MPEGVFRKRFKKKKKLTRRSHPSSLKTETECWRPRAAVVAGGDPRRGRGIGWYLCAQCILPRRWVVVVVAGEHHVDGSPCSGGWWFG